MTSVCIATFNGSKFIKAQLNSILEQIQDHDEIIISDDSSTDDTVSIIKGFNDKRIILLENQRFNSPIYNFENAIKCSAGDIIFLSDQDDIWLPNKMKIMEQALLKVDLVISDAMIVDSNLNVIYESFYKLYKIKKGFIYSLYRNPFLGCAMAFKREILKKALPFPKKIPMHDIWLGMVAETYFSTLLLQEKLIFHRRHGHNTSNVSEKSFFSFKEKIYFRIRILIELLKIFRKT